tara:strand:- start:183 stop:530 length:348 start_codon:yes stop_codon:yes gene_type:complete
MSWKNKVRRMAAKVAPAKMNTKKNKNEDWKNTKDKKASGKELKKEDWKKWLANKKKQRDEGVEESSKDTRGRWRDRTRCSMCSRIIYAANPATVTDPKTGLKYCNECAYKKGLRE